MQAFSHSPPYKPRAALLLVTHPLFFKRKISLYPYGSLFSRPALAKHSPGVCGVRKNAFKWACHRAVA
ncbi:hypothetical protein HK12_07240 [Acetobacter orientalis]|uniref:Uncharacterized protein n=1 Tax=Acetobacter orientalis TaxID=146474 RepID=A0A252A130_9PROT|nr:hypothetical protein HK12_07240 [Acetobacter orientalis]